MNTHSNWCFEDDGMNDFVIEKIKNRITESFALSNSINNNNDFEEMKNEIQQLWTGYCPESYLKNKTVKMRLNKNGFYESEETGLQIVVLSGVQAIILNFRGRSDFKSTPIFGHEIENSEMLSPQNNNKAPFNMPTMIFENSKEIESYIKSIK